MKKTYRTRITLEVVSVGKIDRETLDRLAGDMLAQVESLDDGTYDCEDPHVLDSDVVSVNQEKEYL